MVFWRRISREAEKFVKEQEEPLLGRVTLGQAATTSHQDDIIAHALTRFGIGWEFWFTDPDSRCGYEKTEQW